MTWNGTPPARTSRSKLSRVELGAPNGVAQLDANGNVIGSVTAGAFWVPLQHGRALLQAAGTVVVDDAGYSGSATSKGSGLTVFSFDPADYPTGSTMRVRTVIQTNNTAPGGSMTFGLRAGGSPTGATSDDVNIGSGGNIAATIITQSAPAANTRQVVTTAEFAMLAQGQYAFVVSPGTMASLSGMTVRLRLDIKPKLSS
jgi:hypothetical protein